MANQTTNEDRDRMNQWVETWRRAGLEMDLIRRREIEAADTQKAIRQLFGDSSLVQTLPPRTSSGLVEQQAWFAKLRR